MVTATNTKKKSEFALPQSNFIALIPSCLIRQTFFFFARARALPVLNLNMDYGKSFYYPWSEEKERLLAVYSSTKREIRYFHVLVAQRRLRNVHDARLTLLGRADYCGEWTGHFRSYGEQTRKSIWN